MASERREERDPETTHNLAKQRMESISALAQGIAHDLMGALASISMVLELLSSKLEPADVWLVEALVDGVKRGREGVRQIYSLAAAREGEAILFDPLYLLKEARTLLAQAFPGHEITAEYPPEVGLVRVELSLLRQLLLGIGVAACLEAPAPASLHLRASRRPPEGEGDGAGAAAVCLEVESRAEGEGPTPRPDAEGWRLQPGMAALLAVFEEQGGTFAGGPEGSGFRARIELPVAEPQEVG